MSKFVADHLVLLVLIALILILIAALANDFHARRLNRRDTVSLRQSQAQRDETTARRVAFYDRAKQFIETDPERTFVACGSEQEVEGLRFQAYAPATLPSFAIFSLSTVAGIIRFNHHPELEAKLEALLAPLGYTPPAR